MFLLINNIIYDFFRFPSVYKLNRKNSQRLCCIQPRKEIILWLKANCVYYRCFFRQYLLFHCMPDTSMIPVFFSGWKFAPVQVDVCFIDSNAKLVDENANTILALGLFTLRVRRNDSEFSGHK